MTSEERHELRYQRRRTRRLQKRMAAAPIANSYRSVYTTENLWRSYKLCRKNVTWKGSVQRYILSAPIRISRTKKQLEAHKYKCVEPHEWDTWERGKKRHIKSVPIGERVVQRTLADQSLLPSLQKMFVYDNGACMKFKGYDFAVRRLKAHLQQYYRKHGSTGYVLLYDFSKFYESIDHGLIRSILRTRLSDPLILGMVNQILSTFGQGLGLGSQISQVLALASANELDHVIKQELHMKYSARYNDDGYIIHHDKAVLQNCLERIREVCAKLHITLNEKKTQIVRLEDGFKFLKSKTYLTETGFVVRKIPKSRVYGERRRLRKMRRLLDAGKLTFDQIQAHYKPHRAYSVKYFNDRQKVIFTDRLFKQLFKEELKQCA